MIINLNKLYKNTCILSSLDNVSYAGGIASISSCNEVIRI